MKKWNRKLLSYLLGGFFCLGVAGSGKSQTLPEDSTSVGESERLESNVPATVKEVRLDYRMPDQATALLSIRPLTDSWEARFFFHGTGYAMTISNSALPGDSGTAWLTFEKPPLEYEDPQLFAEHAHKCWQQIMTPFLSAIPNPDSLKRILIDGRKLPAPLFLNTWCKTPAAASMGWKDLDYAAKHYSIQYATGPVKNLNGKGPALFLPHDTTRVSASYVAFAPGISKPQGEADAVASNLVELAETYRGGIFWAEKAATAELYKETESHSIIHVLGTFSIPDQPELAWDHVGLNAGPDYKDILVFPRMSGNGARPVELMVMQGKQTKSNFVALRNMIPFLAKTGYANAVLTDLPASAPEIMQQTLLRLKTGQDKDLALWEAQKAYLETCKGGDCHPKNWAGVQLWGKRRGFLAKAIPISKGPLFLIFAGIVLSLLTAIGRAIWLRRRATRRRKS